MSREEHPSASVRKQRLDASARRENLSPLAGEIIGERVLVKDSGCRELLALKGTVEDETLSTLVIRTNAGERKIVPKRGTVFVFPDLNCGGGCEARGDDFACRPEDRTKRIAQKLAKKRT
jgi:RNase P/RNase MRP subunit p29